MLCENLTGPLEIIVVHDPQLGLAFEERYISERACELFVLCDACDARMLEKTPDEPDFRRRGVSDQALHFDLLAKALEESAGVLAALENFHER